jgi:4a-hydroxytetrahydrobiopterin dehydratase
MAQKLSEEEARRRLDDDLQAWAVREGELYRNYRTANWRVTLMTANVIGFLAEAAYHHPRLVLNYRSVEVYLSTHDADGLTENDFNLARQIEKTVRWPAEEVGKLDAPPRDWLRE